ncbi:MAG: hypothetical protein WGN25_10525 [Candidatus Electrothrix sp. GW3-4]|uniref:hypothetical protein n=1 Tax=Candidatus Electrothrix sp. GW3-4 TaxID=3126740 RepID=UPI0030D0A2F2
MKKVLRTLLIVSVFMLYSQSIFCAEEISNEAEPTDDNTVTDVVKETSENKFNDRERLVQTLLGNLLPDESESPDNTGNIEKPGNDDDPLTEAEATAFVEQLSNEQVFAFNRSLNNAVNNGLEIKFDKEELEKAENYTGQQINALTKAMEEEAKFLALFEKTGNEKFQERAERQKEKFLSKIDKFQDTDDSASALESGDAVKNNVKEEAKARAKDTAKQAAQKAAKEAAKAAAKEAAHEAAQEVVKEAANTAKKESVKERQAEKIVEREAAKAARDEAKDAAKAEKDAAKDAAKTERDAAKAERDAAKDAAKTERDAAKAEKTANKK